MGNTRPQEVFGIETPYVLDGSLAVFRPAVEQDRHDNWVSQIILPNRSYNMVHFPSKSWKIDSAAIYGGRDQFVRYSGYNSDNDIVADYVQIFTGLGDFYVSWGDGDFLGFYYPEILNANDDWKRRTTHIQNKIGGIYQGNGERPAFILLVMELLDYLLAEPALKIWLTKADWELKKQELQAERNQRRYSR